MNTTNNQSILRVLILGSDLDVCAVSEDKVKDPTKAPQLCSGTWQDRMSRHNFLSSTPPPVSPCSSICGQRGEGQTSHILFIYY